MVDDRNNKYHISYAKYKELDKRWKHNKHVEKKMVRRDSSYTTVGDKYNRPGFGSRHMVYWDYDFNTSEPIVKEYTYENRLQTQSHWGKVSEADLKTYDVFEYPSVPGGWRLQTILSNGPRFPKADKYLQFLNGYLNTNKGGYKKVRLWMLIYSDQPQDVADFQRSHWKGGNKNEIIVMIGTNKSKEITWADVMTQADSSDALMIKIRDEILLKMTDNKSIYSGKLTDLDLLVFSNWLGKSVRAEYIKPDFKQYDYIQVSPSMFAIILSYIIVLIVNIGVGVFVIYNAWHDKGYKEKQNSIYYY